MSAGDDQIRTDKTTIRDVLRTLVPFGAPTTGWRVVQIDNDMYIVANAKYDGAVWSHDDTSIDAIGLRFSGGATSVVNVIYRDGAASTWTTASWLIRSVLDEHMDRVASDVINFNLDNSATETTAATLTIPANTLGVDGAIMVEVTGEVTNNLAATDDLTLRVKFDGTTLASFVLETVATSATPRPFWARVMISNRNATNSQGTWGDAWIGAPNVSGVGSAAVTRLSSGHSSGAVDTTVTKNVAVTVQLSSANPLLSVDLRVVHIYVIK